MEDKVKYVAILHDDTELANKLIKRLNQAGISVSVYKSNHELFQSINTRRPEFIVSRLMTKLINGFKVVVTVNSLPESERPPVAIIGQDNKTYKKLAKKLGVVEYIDEPASYIKLQAIVQTWLKKIEEMKSKNVSGWVNHLLDTEPEKLDIKEDEKVYRFSQNQDDVDTKFNQASFKKDNSEKSKYYSHNISKSNDEEHNKSSLMISKINRNASSPNTNFNNLQGSSNYSEKDPGGMFITDQNGRFPWQEEGQSQEEEKQAKIDWLESYGYTEDDADKIFHDLEGRQSSKNKDKNGFYISDQRQKFPWQEEGQSQEEEKQAKREWQKQNNLSDDEMNKRFSNLNGHASPGLMDTKQNKHFPWQREGQTQEDEKEAKREWQKQNNLSDDEMNKRFSNLNGHASPGLMDTKQNKHFPWQREGQTQEDEQRAKYDWQKQNNLSNEEMDKRFDNLQGKSQPGLINTEQNKMFPWQKEYDPDAVENSNLEKNLNSKNSDGFFDQLDKWNQRQGYNNEQIQVSEKKSRYPWETDDQTEEEREKAKKAWERENGNFDEAIKNKKFPWQKAKSEEDSVDFGNDLSGTTDENAEHFDTKMKFVKGETDEQLKQKLNNENNQSQEQVSVSNGNEETRTREAQNVDQLDTFMRYDKKDFQEKTKKKKSLRDRIKNFKDNKDEILEKRKEEAALKQKNNEDLLNGDMGGGELEGSLESIEVALILEGSDNIAKTKEPKEIIEEVMSKISQALEETGCTLFYIYNDKPYSISSFDKGLIEVTNLNELKGADYIQNTKLTYIESGESDWELPVMNIPLIEDNEIIGCLYLRRYRDLNFSQREHKGLTNIIKGMKGVILNHYATMLIETHMRANG